ncbi:MAG: hypothetical protein R3F62_13195 [Planctomycetota bacterium]
MKSTPDDALGKLALAHLLGALEESEAALFEAYAASCPDSQVLDEAAQDLACLSAPPVAPPASAWRGIQEALRHKRAGTEPVAPAPDDVILVSCSYCRDGLERGGTVYCASCLAPHHPDCFREHGRCSVMGCGETQVVRAAGVADPAPQALPPARPRRWRRRLGWGVFVVAGGAAAAFSEYQATTVGVSAFPEPVPSPRPPDPPERYGVQWSDATLGEVVDALRAQGGQVRLDPEQEAALRRLRLPPRELAYPEEPALAAELAGELGLALRWDPEPTLYTQDPERLGRLATLSGHELHHGTYVVDAQRPGLTTTLGVGLDAHQALARAAAAPVWAEVRGGRVRLASGGTPLGGVSLEGEPRALALAADGSRAAWVVGRDVFTLQLGSFSAAQVGQLPESFGGAWDLDLDLHGRVLLRGERGWFLLGAGELSPPRWVGDGVSLAARPEGGWWAVAADGIHTLSVREGGPFGSDALLDDGLAALVDAPLAAQREALAGALARGVPPDRLEAAPWLIEPPDPRDELLAVAIFGMASAAAGVVRRGEDLVLSVVELGVRSPELLLDRGDGLQVALAWKEPRELLVLQSGPHNVALHTVQVGDPGPQVEHTLHTAVSRVSRVLPLVSGEVVLELQRQSERTPSIWIRPFSTRELPPRPRAGPGEAEFYSARWATPVEVPEPAVDPVGRPFHDAAYAEAREVVLGRKVLDFPRAGKILRDVPRGSAQRVEAEQLLAFLLAHGQVHCEGLYREGQADSAILLGRQLADLAQGTPIAAVWDARLAHWSRVLELYGQASTLGPDPEAEPLWSELLELEREFGNYYNRRARRGLAALEAVTPPPAPTTLDLSHVRPGQRWVWRQGDAEAEWEVVRVEGDDVIYRARLHLQGRPRGGPGHRGALTPAELKRNLGQAQGGGVESRGPRRAAVPGVSSCATWCAQGGRCRALVAVDAHGRARPSPGSCATNARAAWRSSSCASSRASVAA